MTSSAYFSPAPLPVGGVDHKGVGWLGMLCLIVSEGSIFIYLLFSYFYYAIQNNSSFMPLTQPSLRIALPNTVLLLVSAAAIWRAEHSAKKGSRSGQIVGLAIGIICGGIFVFGQWAEWQSKTFSLSSSLYGSIYFVTAGFHMVHLLAGLLALLAIFLWSALGYFDSRTNTPVQIAAIYWYFVVAVGIVVFFTYDLTPYLG